MSVKDKTDVIATNLNRRLSGVTSTVVRLVPLQRQKINIAAFGVGLPHDIPRIGLSGLLMAGYRKKPVVFHARRNIEMLLGIFLKSILRQNLKLLFTSASQREHTPYTKKLINRMDRIIATSNAGSKYLDHDCDVVYHGINIDEFSPVTDQEKVHIIQKLGLPEKKLVGCFGRIRRQKGTDVFIDTMIELLPKHPDWSAIILGRTTPEHQSFLHEQIQKIENAGLQDRIVFVNEVPVDKVNQYYRALSLFIAPQRWEGFGLTPLEAMATGVPVVATRVGVFPELIKEGETGFLSATTDPATMAEATHKLMGNEALRKKFSKSCREDMVANFRIENEADRLIEIYQEMINS